MKFLDLNTGYSFDGLWDDSQSKGYIFWFPNEQSTNITYSIPICVLTENDSPLELSIEDNSIFSFISHTNIEIIDNSEYYIPEYTKSISVTPEKLGDYYGHIFYVCCKSEYEGEFICKIKIGDTGYIRVGADFYGEFEPYDVNLSNFGVEIPDTIQKAIYDSNVHEDYKDNILMNRKYKELLSNYWDIVANKGSYKSLKNSLDWFEWGDVLSIKEIWKRNNAGKILFDDKNIMSIFEDKISEAFSNFIKTSYVSLICSMYSDSDKYDSEGNPELVENVFKWAKNDINIKLSLLTQFFGEYFLPIHMGILYSSLEDRVYTNTIKALSGDVLSRYDLFGDFNYVESNIKDGDIYKLDNVVSCVNKNTVYYHESGFGVDHIDDYAPIEMQKFADQYYCGPGAFIPITLTIPNQHNKDFIKQTLVDFDNVHLEMHDIFKVKNGSITINFNFLAKEAKNYVINMTFILASGKTITKKLNFFVEDADNLILNVYKVQAKDDKNGFTYEDFKNVANSKYFFTLFPNESGVNKYYYQYLPYMHPDNPLFASYKGIKLNRTVAIENNNLPDGAISLIRSKFYNYLEYRKVDADGNIKYLIFVSKHFYEDLPKGVEQYKIIKNELVFYPQFHNLVKMTGLRESNYTVSQYEAVCCSPEISVNNRISKPFKYSYKSNNTTWTFINSSTKQNFKHPSDSRQPFVVSDNDLITPGYYDISFKYSLANGICGECKLDSAFRIKTI